MRALLAFLVLASSTALAGPSISDEFAFGFGGVPWGIELPALAKEFPGGYQIFSTDPGGVAYALNLDDPVFGISRRGMYVVFEIGVEKKVDQIQIQIPYEQTANLLATITSRFGPVIGPEVNGIVTTYHWPSERGFILGVRTTTDAGIGLTTMSIRRRLPSSAAKPKGAARGSLLSRRPQPVG